MDDLRAGFAPLFALAAEGESMPPTRNLPQICLTHLLNRATIFTTIEDAILGAVTSLIGKRVKIPHSRATVSSYEIPTMPLGNREGAGK